MDYTKILLFFGLIMNIIAFSAMGIDKRKAIKGFRRIPEKTLFLLSLLGGSFGAFLGMYAFRHKTKHLSFKIGFPLILILHMAIVFCILYFFNIS